MTKEELVQSIAKECDLPKSHAKEMLDSVFHNISKCLKNNDKISLTGFGTFYVARRKARVGRNPQTGAALQIKARNLPKFRPGKELKQYVAK